MTALIAVLVFLAVPFVAVSTLLALVEHLQNKRDAARDQQIMLTDAIHWELGAVAAPVVTRRRGGWRVSMAVPLDRPADVAALLRVTRGHFAANGNGTGPLEIVLTPARSAASPCAAVKNLAPARGTTNTSLAA
jgi:hypothetical protein